MLQLFYSAAETITPAAEQTASAPPSLFITIVASAFGGAILTSAVTVWTKFTDSKAEHRRWVKQAKLETYTEFGKLAYKCLEEISLDGKIDQARQTKSELVGLHPRIILLSNKKITSEALAIQVLIKGLVSPRRTLEADIVKDRGEISDLLTALLRNMQKDLGIKLGDDPDDKQSK